MVVFRRDPLTGRQMHQIYQLCSWGQNPKAKASTLKAKVKAWTFETKTKAISSEALAN